MRVFYSLADSRRAPDLSPTSRYVYYRREGSVVVRDNVPGRNLRHARLGIGHDRAAVSPTLQVLLNADAA